MRLSTAALLRERREGKAEGNIRGKAEAVRGLMETTGKSSRECCNMMKIPESEREALLDFLEKDCREKEENSEEVSEKGEAVL